MSPLFIWSEILTTVKTIIDSFQVEVFLLPWVIPTYFILFDATVNGITSMLVYRNTADFCILILYPATLQIHWQVPVVSGGTFRIFYT